MLKIKSDKLFNATSSLIIGIVLIIIGIFWINFKGEVYYQLIQFFTLAILFLSVKQLVNFFLGKNKDKNVNFAKCFLNLIFCLALSLFKNIPLSILPLIFGGYFLVNGFVKLINYLILLKNKTHGRLFELISSLFYFILSIPVILSPIKNINRIVFLLGWYFILLGLNYFGDFITFLIPKKWKNKIKRRFRISLPSFIEAIIPFTVLNEINYLIDEEDYDNFVFEEKNGNETPDMEVFVHTSDRGFNRMGHVDLYYQGKVIAYGNYDDASFRLFDTIGDGVIFTTNREKYIPFCIEHSGKTLFAFGLKLTESQKKNIDKELENLFSQLVEWKPPYVKALSKNKKVKSEQYDDYASVLYQNTGAKFYKFTSGRFQKYFVLGANCCRLADLIIGKSGIDLLKMNGIITPGTYYEYLNREFQKKNSIVISRNIYNEQSTKKKKLPSIIKNFSKNKKSS